MTRWQQVQAWAALVYGITFLVAVSGLLLYVAHMVIVDSGADPRTATTVMITVCTFIVLVSVLAALRAKRRRARRYAVEEAWAAENGWMLDRGDRSVLHRRTGGLVVISRTRGYGRARRHVVVVRIPGVVMPTVTLRRERTVPDRAALQGRDIQVEHEEFNRRWRVRAANREFAHAVLHPRLMEWLMGADLDEVRIRIEVGEVTVKAPGPMDLDRVRPLAALALEIAHSIPVTVRRDHTAGRGQTRRERQAAIEELNR